jgi:hypothetical protein
VVIDVMLAKLYRSLILRKRRELLEEMRAESGEYPQVLYALAELEPATLGGGRAARGRRLSKRFLVLLYR